MRPIDPKYRDDPRERRSRDRLLLIIGALLGFIAIRLAALYDVFGAG